jgi:HEAT repeat protein
VARGPTTEDALRAIKSIRDAPESYDLERDLAPFLKHKSNHVIAAAASTLRRLESAELAQELADAFLVLMKDPAKLDPGCKATISIAETLAAMDQGAAKVYFAGVRHVQMEGSFGPPVDAAAPLRGLCAQGLARMMHPEALEECVTLLADRWIPARTGALRAIGDSGRPEGLLLLRLKVLLGDEDDEVIAECFAALLRLGQGRSLDFVARFITSSSSAIAQRAALALGDSHLPAAFPLLRDAWEHATQSELRRTVLLAMAVLRQDEALDFLLERVATDTDRVSKDALEALEIYRDEVVRKRIEEAVAQRGKRLTR